MADRYKLTEAAKRLGMGTRTLRRWVVEGRAPSIRSATGRLFIPAWWVEEQSGQRPPSQGVRCALYVRESSLENKAALESQKRGLIQYATAKGYQITHIVCEIGSGVNDERKRLHGLLKERDFDVLLVEHKERLSRFGFRWFESLASFRIEVINTAENRVNDLMEDLVAILTSFSARLYGQRRGRKKAEAALKAAQPEIARASNRKVMHKNAASRKISRLAHRIKAIGG
jgi:putative resolvase